MDLTLASDIKRIDQLLDLTLARLSLKCSFVDAKKGRLEIIFDQVSAFSSVSREAETEIALAIERTGRFYPLGARRDQNPRETSRWS